jgi:hypothetical protein
MRSNGRQPDRRRCAGWIIAILLAAPASADINLEWRPQQASVTVGDQVGIGLYAVSDNSTNQLFSAVQLIMGWEPDALQLVGTDETGGIGLFSSSFPANDAFGLNEMVPPADGDGLWVGLAFPSPLPATPQGSLLTTMLFEAVAVSPDAAVEMWPSGGQPTGFTKVIGDVPNLDVLGTLSAPATVVIVPEPGGLLPLALVGLLGGRGVRPRIAHRAGRRAEGGVSC